MTRVVSSPPPRFRRSAVHGYDCTAEEYQTANRLLVTYQIECQSFQSRSGRGPGWEGKIVNEISLLPEERLRGGRCENPELLSREKRKAPGRSARMWLALAKAIIAREFDPEKFIRSQFVMLPAWASAPRPQALANAQAFSNYYVADKTSDEEIRLAFLSQLEVFNTEASVRQSLHPEWTEYQVYAGILADLELALSALFRYCVSRKLAIEADAGALAEFDELTRRYKLLAALQYLRYAEAYDKVMVRWLPAGYRVQAGEISKRHYGLKTQGSAL